MPRPKSFKWLVCFFLGHKEVKVTLTLGKIVREKVEAIRCERCNRIFVPIPQLDNDVNPKKLGM